MLNLIWRKLKFALGKIFALKISEKQIMIRMLQVTQYFVLMINVTGEILITKFIKLLITLEFLQSLNSYNLKMAGTQMKQ